MACNDIVSAILHYKRNIDKISDPPERALKYEDRLLHCINKLYKLPVNVNHLQETGVGRTVNSLRKIEGVKGLGDAAKALVAKWKTMVMLEDEAERKQKEESSGPSDEDMNRLKIIRESEKLNEKKTENSSRSQSNEKHKSKSQEDSKKHKHETLDSGKSRKRKHEDDKNSKHKSKHRHVIDEGSDETSEKILSESKEEKSASKSQLNDSNYSSSKKNLSSSHKSSELIKEEKKKSKKSESHSSTNSKSFAESLSSKHHKSSKKDNEKHHREKDKKKFKVYPENNGIDSCSGASFADALGPMIVKKSPKKKNSSVVSSPTLSDHSCDNNVVQVNEKKETVAKKDVKEMLFSQPKLEPLEPDLMVTLPTPTPYYKPHPSYVPSPEAVKKRVQAEEDALTTIMSNKNTRTKVYSGVKGGLLYVPSLYECCCRVLQQHIDALEYTGGIPFSLLKPVLEGATPSQLYQFEHFNPYIIEDTDDLWKFHVNKEFRSQKRQEFESWKDMYLRCIDEREEKYKAVTANILQRTIEKSVPVRKAKLAYIDVAKPPRNILKKQLKNGTSKPDSSRLLGKNDPDAVKVSATKQLISKEPASFKVKPKVAPLMQKTLKSIKMSRFKR